MSLSDYIAPEVATTGWIQVDKIKQSIQELKEDLYKAITKRKWDAINTHLLDIIIEDAFGKDLVEAGE